MIAAETAARREMPGHVRRLLGDGGDGRTGRIGEGPERR